MNNKKEKTLKMILTFSLIVFVTSLASKFILCGLTTIENGKVQTIFTSKSDLEKEISRLSYIDSSLSSISYVETQAKDMGFISMVSRLNSIDPKAPLQVAALSR